MSDISPKTSIEFFIQECAASMSEFIRQYLEAHSGSRTIVQSTTVKPITTYNEEYEEAKIGDWVWVESLNRVCLVTGHSSQPGQPIFVQYYDISPHSPFDVSLWRACKYPGEYVIVVRRQTDVTYKDDVKVGDVIRIEKPCMFEDDGHVHCVSDTLYMGAVMPVLQSTWEVVEKFANGGLRVRNPDASAPDSARTFFPVSRDVYSIVNSELSEKE